MGGRILCRYLIRIGSLISGISFTLYYKIVYYKIPSSCTSRKIVSNLKQNKFINKIINLFMIHYFFFTLKFY
jgi:hypothetical protein